MIPSLILSVRFLTVLPVPGREAEGRGALGRAAWWFPVVGLGLGAALVALDRVLALAFPPLVSAVLVLSCWKVATGGIHLDGLADCLDGLGGRDRADRLSIMKDSRIGTFGAVGLILDVLIALLALAAMPAGTRWRILLLAPTVGRLVPLLVAPRFGAATPDRGAGGPFQGAASSWAGPVHLIAVAALGAWLLGPWGAGMIVIASGVVFVWSAFLASRLGGLTGDALGSGVELAEIAILLAGASLAHRGIL